LHLGGSINHAGAKATVIGLKSDDIGDRVVADAEKGWSSGHACCLGRRHVDINDDVDDDDDDGGGYAPAPVS
jgi:hypothetical protein